MCKLAWHCCIAFNIVSQRLNSDPLLKRSKFHETQWNLILPLFSPGAVYTQSMHNPPPPFMSSFLSQGFW